MGHRMMINPNPVNQGIPMNNQQQQWNHQVYPDQNVRHQMKSDFFQRLEIYLTFFCNFQIDIKNVQSTLLNWYKYRPQKV